MNMDVRRLLKDECIYELTVRGARVFDHSTHNQLRSRLAPLLLQETWEELYPITAVSYDWNKEIAVCKRKIKFLTNLVERFHGSYESILAQWIETKLIHLNGRLVRFPEELKLKAKEYKTKLDELAEETWIKCEQFENDEGKSYVHPLTEEERDIIMDIIYNIEDSVKDDVQKLVIKEENDYQVKEENDEVIYEKDPNISVASSCDNNLSQFKDNPQLENSIEDEEKEEEIPLCAQLESSIRKIESEEDEDVPLTSNDVQKLVIKEENDYQVKEENDEVIYEKDPNISVASSCDNNLSQFKDIPQLEDSIGDEENEEEIPLSAQLKSSIRKIESEEDDVPLTSRKKVNKEKRKKRKKYGSDVEEEEKYKVKKKEKLKKEKTHKVKKEKKMKKEKSKKRKKYNPMDEDVKQKTSIKKKDNKKTLFGKFKFFVKTRWKKKNYLSQHQRRTKWKEK